MSELSANWGWIVAYVIAAAITFIWLRRFSSTDVEAAELATQSRTFESHTSLARIAAEFFHIATPRVLLVVIALTWMARIAARHWSPWDLAIMAAVLAFWPLQEWLIHVLLLHLKPFSFWGREIDPIICRNHRNHHRDPWHPHLGITPPHIIWLYLAGLPGVWLLFLPWPQALTGMALYFSLVLNYEWLHYLIHTAYVPRFWFYKRLWRNHRLHHFKNEHYWFGVTMLSGDRLFRTQPLPSDTDRSETCLTLGAETEFSKWTNAPGTGKIVGT
ncbi:MAG TPA: sterol desaturase family protein [Pirellulales bacterium]|nr:sterol desaturase family protein [Pirellulales bacterium]